MSTQHTPEADWKTIALELAKRVNFAVVNCECKGGCLLNTETMKVTNWRDYMAEAIEMIPGTKIDREILATLSLPKSKRRKAQQEIKAQRAAIAKATGAA